MNGPDPGVLDLGDGHRLIYHFWAPDRELNPLYADLPDVERFGASIEHRSPAGVQHVGGITFDGPVQRQVSNGRAFWQVEQWDPLTISPSILCSCGDHGWIRDGRWVS